MLRLALHAREGFRRRRTRMYYLSLEFHKRKQCVSVRSRVWIAVKKRAKIQNSVVVYCFSLVLT